MKKKLQTLFFFLLSPLFIMACRSFVEVNTPQTELIRSTVFESDKTANAAMLVIYSQMAVQGLSYNYLSFYPGLLSDELTDFTAQTSNVELYSNNVLTNNGAVSEMWSAIYKLVYETNAIIEGIDASASLTQDVRKQLKGEALFTRAFFYFYLTNYFGDVPYIDNTDYKRNAILPRVSSDEIYSKITRDLEDARSMLNEQFVGADGVTPSNEHLRPNQAAAAALLARVYLYRKEYAQAAKMSSEVIEKGNLHIEADLDAVFLKNSSEAIWQVSTGIATNTYEGYNYILYSYPYYAGISTQLVKAFDANDLRRSHWIGTYSEGLDTFYFPYKYKVQWSTDVTEYVMVLRLAEQYLIHSEAMAQLNNIPAANKDLNIIRGRAGFQDTLIANKDALMDCLLNERQRELFTEWGHRWFDLKRTGKVDVLMAVVTPYKGGNWQPYKSLLPIPQDEIMKNNKLSQNTGY